MSGYGFHLPLPDAHVSLNEEGPTPRSAASRKRPARGAATTMSKPKKAPVLTPVGPIDWSGVRLQRIDYQPGSTIFAQGDLATSVMYVDSGAVRLSVVSHAGKEA